MSQSVSRQQRRKMERELKKQGKLPQAPTKPTVPNSEYVTRKEMQSLIQDTQKVLNYAKLVDNHIWMLVETLDRKGVLGWSDVNDTESLYNERDTKKQDKVKLLLEQDLSVVECLEEVKDDLELPGYLKLNIDPIKDLNCNPYEVGVHLRELNPDLSQDEYLALGKSWDMTLEHFGFKAEKKPE